VLITLPAASVASETVSTRSRYVAVSGRFGRPGSTERTWTPFMPWSPNCTDSTTTAAAAGSPR
jgi:hypothetical protein